MLQRPHRCLLCCGSVAAARHSAVIRTSCYQNPRTAQWNRSTRPIKVWWHCSFSFPAVSMLLSNSGLMDQLQTVFSSSSSSSSSSATSLSPSACPPLALLCCCHLLLSSLITLQRVHSTQVHTTAQLCSYHNFTIQLHTVKGKTQHNVK